jgi:hypothetical protein
LLFSFFHICVSPERARDVAACSAQNAKSASNVR